MSLNLQIIEAPGSIRINLEGSLDSETYMQLDDELSRAVMGETKVVAFDLEKLNFLSSAGLRVFFKLIKKLKAQNGKVMVTKMQPGVKKVFEIVKVLPDLSVFASLEEFDHYLETVQKKASEGE